jgi:adenylate cyclase
LNKKFFLIISFLIISLNFLIPSGLLNIENNIYDLKQKVLPLKLEKNNIIIVSINDKSINLLEEELGRWPWERDKIGEIVEFIASSKPEILIIDILMPNPSQGDEILRKALSKVPHIIAADFSERKSVNKNICFEGKKAIDFKEKFKNYDYALLPCTLINEKTKIGSIHLFSDEDGILRKYPLWQKSNDMFYPSLSNSYFEKIGKEIKLHFYGKGGDFEYLDAFKIYVAKKIQQEEGEIKEVEEIKKRLEGKIVFLGVTATGGFDLKSVPTSKIYPGVEIHTTAFQNLKDLSFIKDLPFYLYLMISFLFIFIFFIILINSKLGLQILNLIIFLFGITFFSFYLFSININFPISFLNISFLFLFFSNLIIDYSKARKERKKIEETFSRYVSPSVLNFLLSQKALPELGGELKEITVLFSDIRNFTTISEKTPPYILVKWLNDYFSLMVPIIFKHNGTLDKFIGDAIMAFWGAPLADKNHSLNALNCAKEMLEELKKWNKGREEEKLPQLNIGIGLNSGFALTGNIGADLGKIKNFQFTALGDVVNTASRLEGLNKELKTEILLSEEVKKNLPENIKLKYLGEFKVKGKEEAVKVYTI